MVQWLRLHASTARGLGSITGQGTKILQALWHGKKKNNKVFKKEMQCFHDLGVDKDFFHNTRNTRCNRKYW